MIKNIVQVTLFLISFHAFGQNEVEIYFFDPCNNSIQRKSFEYSPLIEDAQVFFSRKGEKLVLEKGTYFTCIQREFNNRYGSTYGLFRVHGDKKIIDTLRMSKITLTSDGTLHTTDYIYYNCYEICDGYQVEFDNFGVKKFEGNFIKGKPLYIKEYGEKGIIENHEIYDYPFWRLKRKDSYDSNGNLTGYETYDYSRKKFSKKYFNEKGKLIKKEFTKK